MKIRRSLPIALPLAALALSASGCKTVTCGEGTVLEGEACVPESLARCGAGTTLVGEDCVPDASACGEGTALVGGKCVREGLSCGPGTEQVGDECIVLDPMKAVTVPESTEPNAAPGRFKEFELPAVGAPPVVLGGVIDVPTNDTADLDVFQFAGERLQRLRIEATGVGLPVAGVVIQPADLDATFARFALTTEARGGVREVVLPYGGDWLVIVSDQANLTGGVPLGGPAFSYVVKVTQLEPKAPRALGPDTALRGFHEDVDTFTVAPTAASGNLFDFVLDPPPADTGWPGARAVWISGPDGTLLADVQDEPPYVSVAPVRLALPAGTTVACVDYVYRLGREPAQYTFALEKVPVVALGTLAAPVEQEGDALPKGDQVFSLEVAGSALVKVEAVPATGSQLLPQIEVRNAKYELVATERATTLTRWFSPAEAGSFFIVVRDRTFNANKTNLDYTFRARADAVGFLGPVAVDATSDATGTLDANGVAWLALVAGNDGDFRVRVTPGGAEDLAVELRSIDTKFVVASATGGGPGDPEQLPAVVLLAGNTLLVKVTGPPSSPFAASATGAATKAVVEAEPNDDTAHAQALVVDPVDGAQVIATFTSSADADFYSVTLANPARLVLETKPGIFGGVIDTRAAVLNAAGSTLASNDDMPGRGDLSKIDYAAAAGTYFIRIQRWFSSNPENDYRLQVDVVP